MKNLLKILALILSLIIFAVCLPLSASAVEESRFGRQILSKMPNSSVLLATYDELKTGCENIESDISLSQNITESGLETVVSAFINDYPEYFWITGGYTYTQEENSDYVSMISPEYLFSRSKIAAAKSSLQTMSDKLLEGTEGKSDYDKALIIHDRLAERVVYKSTENDQTAYGAIVEGEAVCAGYARAYHYLLQKAGISAWSIQGKSTNPTTNQPESHRWNLVKLDGKWYYSDVTWDDQPDRVYHNYFNRTLSYFKLTHFPGEFAQYLPEDNSTSLDYFVKNNLVFTKVDTNRLINLLKTSDNTANFYIEGDVNAFMNNLESKMSTIVSALGAKGGASYTYSTSKLGNEVFLNIIIEQKGHKHSLKKVEKISPSCYQTGVKEYYKCSCGRIFADSKAKSEITSSEALILEKTGHSVSEEWRFDQSAHWKYCTVCDADIEGSTSLHTDSDGDLVCEICSAKSDKPFIQDDGSTPKKTELPIYPILIGSAGLLLLIVVLAVILIKKK